MKGQTHLGLPYRGAAQAVALEGRRSFSHHSVSPTPTSPANSCFLAHRNAFKGHQLSNLIKANCKISGLSKGRLPLLHGYWVLVFPCCQRHLFKGINNIKSRQGKFESKTNVKMMNETGKRQVLRTWPDFCDSTSRPKKTDFPSTKYCRCDHFLRFTTPRNHCLSFPRRRAAMGTKLIETKHDARSE